MSYKLGHFKRDSLGKKCKIHLEHGDMIKHIIFFGELGNNKYKYDAQSTIIKNIDILLNGHVIKSIDSLYIKTWLELSYNKKEYNNLSEIVTNDYKREFRTDDDFNVHEIEDRYYPNNHRDLNYLLILNKMLIDIPLRFYNGLPLFILEENNIKLEIEIEFEKEDNIFIEDSNEDIDIFLYVYYDELDPDQKDSARNNKKILFYEDIHYIDYNLTDSSINIQDTTEKRYRYSVFTSIERPELEYKESRVFGSALHDYYNDMIIHNNNCHNDINKQIEEIKINYNGFYEFIKGSYSTNSHNLPFCILSDINKYCYFGNKKLEFTTKSTHLDIAEQFIFVFKRNNTINEESFLNFSRKSLNRFKVINNGWEREGRETNYYNYVVPYKLKLRTPMDGVYTYYPNDWEDDPIEDGKNIISTIDRYIDRDMHCRDLSYKFNINMTYEKDISLNIIALNPTKINLDFIRENKI